LGGRVGGRKVGIEGRGGGGVLNGWGEAGRRLGLKAGRVVEGY